ncbi:MAG TPA: serine/threonine-protein kinase [Gemmataceae bacterium]|nr:serine/threonine-protein kinase [Gemmataceae bacterium]
MTVTPQSSDNQQPPTEAQHPAAPLEPMFVRFGEYELIELIAHGGMGVVYKARDPRLKRIVALKTIRAGGASHPVEAKRFRVEAEAVARLQHPNIVAIHDFGEQNGEPFFTMDYLAGGSLATYRSELLSEPQGLVAIMVKVARAIHYAHEQKVIHRDIKPSNILLDEHGEPKIGDFGLAKLVDADAGISTTGTPLGTFAYMSPEQAKGDLEQIGPASDIWSLGVVLYDLLTGQRPFDGASRVDLVPKILFQEPSPLTAIEPQMDPELESIVLKCLRKDVGERWETMQLLADALQDWLKGQPASEFRFRPNLARATDATTMQTGAGLSTDALETVTRVQPIARYRRWLLLAGCLLLAVGLGFGGWQRGWFSSSDETPEERTARQEIERQLALGQSVQLLGENDQPAYFKWIGSPGSISTAVDGAFTIEAKQMAMLELVRNLKAPHYSLTAYVRHNQGDGWVGLYMARTIQPTEERTSSPQWFASAQFADVGTQAREQKDAAGNAESLFAVWGHCLPPTGSPNQRTLNNRLGALVPFSPTLREPSDWRRIEVRMDESGISLFWGETGQANFKAESISHADINRWMMKADTGKPKFDPPSGGLWLRGGVGLFVWSSSASFKNVTISH